MAEQQIIVATEATSQEIKTTANNIYDKVDTEVATLVNAVGATGNTGGSTTAGTIMGKLNALLTNMTSTRASYIDRLANSSYGLDKIKTDTGNAVTNTATNNTASKTGILSQKLAYLISLLENTTYGLNAIKTAVSSGGGLKNITIQRGTIAFSSGATATATISSVDTSKSFVVYGGVRGSANDYNISANWDATLELTNSTTVTATRYSNTYTSYVTY